MDSKVDTCNASFALKVVGSTCYLTWMTHLYSQNESLQPMRPEQRQNRLWQAIRGSICNSLQRYHLYIDSMPVDDFPEPEQVQRILSNALSVKKMVNWRKRAEDKVPEINSVYAKAMNKIIFDQNLNDEETNKGMLSLLSLPAKSDKPVPRFFLSVAIR